MTRVRIGVIGLGRIGQAAHLRYLSMLRQEFHVAAVADPSPVARSVASERWRIPHVLTTPGELLELPLDAVVIATPVPTHRALIEAALGRGLHVLCEKPLAYDPDECARIARARDRAGRIVQVGYMKRFDTNLGRLLDRVEDPAAGSLVQVTTEVIDPHDRPFRDAHDVVPTTDGDSSSAELLALQRAAVHASVGPVEGAAYRAYRHGYAGSLVHQVNLIHAIGRRLDLPVPAAVADGTFWADGAGVGVELDLGREIRATAWHLTLPWVPVYSETLTLHCERRILTLELTSPYQFHSPARLVEIGPDDESGARRIAYEPDVHEPFRRQLEGFHAAITGQGPALNPPEEAADDLVVVQRAFARACAKHDAHAHPRV